MARQPRLALAGLAHYLVQPGRGDAPVFRDDQDRTHYLKTLSDAAKEQQVALHAYALRDHEVHLLARPLHDGAALGRMVQAIGRRYGAAFNRRHGHVGGLWAGRFRAAALQPGEWVLRAHCLIDGFDAVPPDEVSTRSPVWDSAAHHLGARREAFLTDAPEYWALANTPFSREAAYAALLAEGVGQAVVLRLQQAAARSVPLGDGNFLLSLGEALPMARAVPLRPRGRPRRLA
jgi:putative transposase